MVNSLVWTADEAKYLKAIFRWQESNASLEDEKRRREAEDAARREREQKPAGEFRVLVIGGRGTGKTALLTRVSTLSSLDLLPKRN
jgi:phage terminase large subunit-like protein